MLFRVSFFPCFFLVSTDNNESTQLQGNNWCEPSQLFSASPSFLGLADWVCACISVKLALSDRLFKGIIALFMMTFRNGIDLRKTRTSCNEKGQTKVLARPVSLLVLLSFVRKKEGYRAVHRQSAFPEGNAGFKITQSCLFKQTPLKGLLSDCQSVYPAKEHSEVCASHPLSQPIC